MALPTFRMGLPITANIICIIPHRHAQRMVSIEIPKPIEGKSRLTIIVL